MRAGPLRHLCMLRGLTESKDELNQPVKGWADIGKVWAEIKAPSGRMYEAASQMQAQINAEINIRYRRDVVARQRRSARMDRPTTRAYHHGNALSCL